MKRTVYIILSFTIFLFGFLVYSKLKQRRQNFPGEVKNNQVFLPSSVQESKDYRSSLFKFTIRLPKNFKVEENLTVIRLKNHGGEIGIFRSGTDFDTFGKFWREYLDRNNPDISEEQDLTINNLEAKAINVNHEKMYVLYHQGIVYTLSTSSESLYDDLDQIAQSFRYTPWFCVWLCFYAN